MFKLPSPPSAQAGIHELADFVELTCWNYGTTSKREIIACLGRNDDNDNNVGCDDDDDQNSDVLDEVMGEIERRGNACGCNYPFTLEFEGTVLRHESEDQTLKALVYRFLLLSTRLNMKDNRVHAEVDGTHLLEEISAIALKNYLGGSRAQAIVFGTSCSNSFEDRVNELCHKLREGSGFQSLGATQAQAKDDKLDVVAWVPFSDLLPGQLIVFGQCKTGTTWRDQGTQLQPDVFVKKWLKGTILVNPVRAFCISEAANRAQWLDICVETGILLDRCRLVDFCDCISAELTERLITWTSAAKDALILPGS